MIRNDPSYVHLAVKGRSKCGHANHHESRSTTAQCVSFKTVGSPFIPKGSVTEPTVTGSVLTGPPGQVGTPQGTRAGSNIGTVAGITGSAQPLSNLTDAYIGQSCQNCVCN